jgi:hypothetical protein
MRLSSLPAAFLAALAGTARADHGSDLKSISVGAKIVSVLRERVADAIGA